ncbi:hypothetical protein GCM10010913_04630 [Paenibacillus aceti]|uniref:Uncharacterized protein n=1 Tax=Paenibacillus aceti TaxID=1820010 RepID=A0ABQ1VP87_9BACL|nr:hypothetical protein [Paenibacillus aceti]GGF86237.1 hypothetical protein GCM10010913_04630 [Paenibacillus aceti]
MQLIAHSTLILAGDEVDQLLAAFYTLKITLFAGLKKNTFLTVLFAIKVRLELICDRIDVLYAISAYIVELGTPSSESFIWQADAPS